MNDKIKAQRLDGFLKFAEQYGGTDFCSSDWIHGFNACHSLMSTIPQSVEAEIEKESYKYTEEVHKSGTIRTFSTFQDGAHFGYELAMRTMKNE
jgi:hypothetical protein